MKKAKDMKRNKSTTIAFIGGGAMGEAMVRCLLTKKVADQQDIVVSDVSHQRRELLSREYGVNTTANNSKAVKEADLVILAVKPQNLAQVAADIQGLSPHQLVLSIVAGANLATLRSSLNYPRVVRAMPNMPAQIGEGMTIWTATAETEQGQRILAETVLAALGKQIYVADEKYLDMATALVGSGPAYVFLFIEALIDAGVHIGMARDMAQELAVQTVLGSTLTVEKTGKHPAQLRNMVTSPGGTTTEALFQLEKGRFRSVILEAVTAAYEKSKRLSQPSR